MNEILIGDCREIMSRLINDGVKVQTCITSPPYFGLRDYKVGGQLGREETPEEFVKNLVEVFRLVRNLLNDDGTLFLNLGDTYCSTAPGTPYAPKNEGGKKSVPDTSGGFRPKTPPGMKPKDLMGIPWMVALALRADGWYLRQDIIWNKPNPAPETVLDRCTKSHEYIFLMSKSKSYFYDQEAIREKAITAGKAIKSSDGWDTRKGSHGAYHSEGREKGRSTGAIQGETRNRRSVWTVATQPFRDAHFATFPPELIEPCILAGSRPGDVVFDPIHGIRHYSQGRAPLWPEVFRMRTQPRICQNARRSHAAGRLSFMKGNKMSEPEENQVESLLKMDGETLFTMEEVVAGSQIYQSMYDDAKELEKPPLECHVFAILGAMTHGFDLAIARMKATPGGETVN